MPKLGQIILYAVPAVNCFTGMMYEYALITLLTTIVKGDKSGRVTDDNVDWWTSLFFSSQIITIIFTAAMQGFIADFCGYKSTYLFLNAMMFLGSLIQVFGYSNIIYLLIGQLCIGLSNTIVVSQAYIHSLSDDTQSFKSQAMFTSFILAGGLTGSTISGVIDLYIPQRSWQIVNIISLTLSFFIIIMLLCIYEPNQHRTHKIHTPCLKALRLESSQVIKTPSVREMSFRSGENTFRLRHITTCLMSEFTQGVGVSVIETLFSYILTEIYGSSVMHVSIVYTIFCLCEFVSVTCCFKVESDELRKLWISCIVVGQLFVLTCVLMVYRIEYAVTVSMGLVISTINIPFVLTRSVGVLRIPESRRSRIMAVFYITKMLGCLSMSIVSFPLASVNIVIPYSIAAILFHITASALFYSEIIDDYKS